MGNIGCLFHIKEQFGVSLKAFQLLGFAKVIRRNIPACGKHCDKYDSCKHLDAFRARKSRGKYKLTPKGLTLQKNLEELSDQPEKTQLFLQKNLLANDFCKKLLQFTEAHTKGLEISDLVTWLLTNTKHKLFFIRIAMRDVLDLLISLDLLKIQQGLLMT